MAKITLVRVDHRLIHGQVMGKNRSSSKNNNS